MATGAKRRSAGLGPAVLSAATFGSSGSFASSLLRAGWTPGAAVATRIAVAALVLTVPALLALRRHRAADAASGASAGTWRPARQVVLYGLVAVAGCQLCYFHAVEHLSVAVALLLEYSGALLVVGWLWLRRGQRPAAPTVGGAVTAVVGLVLVLGLLGNHHLDLPGVLWGIGAAVGLAVFFLISAGSGSTTSRSAGSDGEPAALPPLVVAWGGMAVGAVVLAGAGAGGVLPMRAPRVDVILGGARVNWLLPVLGLALLAAAVAYVAGIVAARLLGAKVASFVGLLEVLFAVVFAWLLLGQHLAGGQLAGAGFVLAGIALVRLDELRQPGDDRPQDADVDEGQAVRA